MRLRKVSLFELSPDYLKKEQAKMSLKPDETSQIFRQKEYARHFTGSGKLASAPILIIML